MKATSIVAIVGGSLIVGLIAFALTSKVEGQVVDDATGAPIPGAFVVGVWRGYANSFAHGSTGCYHIEFRTTDAEGRFSLSDFTGNLNPLRSDRQLSIGAYAPGYTVEQQAHEGQFRARRRIGDASKQFSEISMAPTYDCVGQGDPRVLPMYRAFAREMAELATTKAQRKASIDAQYLVDLIELGENEALRRSGARLTRMYEEMERIK